MSSTPESILVTGAAGFLGSHLVEHYASRGHKVIGLDNFCTGLRDNVRSLQDKFGDRYHFLEADVANEWSSLIPTELSQSISHIFHFASPASPKDFASKGIEILRANSMGLERCLEFASQSGARVVFASSSEVYGDLPLEILKESERGNVNSFGPRACYDEGKRFGEALIYSWNARFGTHHGAVRIFNTYGPRMNPEDGRVVIDFLSKALAGRSLNVHGEGGQTRSFCYVDDLIDGVIRYAEGDFARPMNIGNDNEISILDLAEAVRELFGGKIHVQFEGLPTDDPRRRRPDLTWANEALRPWRPQVALKEGLRKTLAWLQDRPRF